MICKPCAETADWQSAGGKGLRWLDRHKDCKGCGCQHKPVKEGWIVG